MPDCGARNQKEDEMFSRKNFSSGANSMRFSGLMLAALAALVPGLFAQSAPPRLILLDPVPALLSGASVTTNVNTLARKGRVIAGVGADGATEMVVRIPANSDGEEFTLTVINDQGQQSKSAAEDGGLGAIGSNTFTLSQLTVTATKTDKGPMAFAIYGVPVDFPRPEGQDGSSTERFITLHAEALDSGSTSDTPVTVLRPPLVLIHGLWADRHSWDNFTPLITDPRFDVNRVDYAQVIGKQIKSYSPSYPSWAKKYIKDAQASSLGFSYNAPGVLKQIDSFVQHFKKGTNPEKIPVAGVQADIVAHSMGGDITRTLPVVSGFYADNTFTLGPIHKVITIGTPHWGSPLAIHLIDHNNECVRGLLATAGSPSFSSVTFKNGKKTTGGVYDLQGDGFDGSLSPALKKLQRKIPHPLPTALIQGLESQSQLDGLDSSTTAAFIRNFCAGDYLADHLTSTGWPEIFSQDSDSIVPAMSAVAGLTDFTQIDGVIHSASSEQLGFGPPAELDAAGGIPDVATGLLNTTVTNAIFVPLPQ
jgi:pimeloyl-ACP methyl ester carboxylesterase